MLLYTTTRNFCTWVVRKVDRRIIALYGIAAILCVLVVLLAVITTPELAPAVMVDHSTTDATALSTEIKRPTETAAPEETTLPVMGSDITDSGAAVTGTQSTGTTAFARKLSINTATKEELMRINGIGEVLAGRIIAYRESHAGFDSLEELMQVSGIGEKRYQAMLPYITL